MVYRTKMMLILLISIVLILQACEQKPTTEEKIYHTLEKVVTLEETFKNQQEPLVKLEEKEKNLYDKIISLGMKEFNQISKLSDEALAIVQEREEKIKKEKESIETAQQHFNTVKKIIEEIEDDVLRKEANALYEIMEDRYSAYDELYKYYIEAIEHDKALYTMFKDKDLTLEKLEAQINKINQTYEKVMKLNEIFNQHTDKYNKAKISFYEKAGLEVEYTK